MDRALFNSRAYLDDGKTSVSMEQAIHAPTDATAGSPEELPAPPTLPLEDPESPPVD
jgi:hypothetical protein